jgi:hypothetical protein
MFTAAERERVQRRLVEIAESDPRIVAAALVKQPVSGLALQHARLQDLTPFEDALFAGSARGAHRRTVER